MYRLVTGSRSGPLKGSSKMNYSDLIANAIGTNDKAVCDLVEEFMRDGRSGLDGLSPAEFDELARQSMCGVLVWDMAGAVNGLSLRGYCEAVGLTYPTELNRVGAIFAVS